MPKNRQPIKDTLAIWEVITLALGVFGGACFGLLRITTALPTWAIILISIPVAAGGFAFFTWTHRTNGFDGPMISMDEFKAKQATMTPPEREQYLAGFPEADREILKRELRNDAD